MQKQHTFKRRKLNKAYDKIGSTVRYTWGHKSSTRSKMGYTMHVIFPRDSSVCSYIYRSVALFIRYYITF